MLKLVSSGSYEPTRTPESGLRCEITPTGAPVTSSPFGFAGTASEDGSSDQSEPCSRLASSSHQLHHLGRFQGLRGVTEDPALPQDITWLVGDSAGQYLIYHLRGPMNGSSTEPLHVMT
jgi:hypothetical protein